VDEDGDDLSVEDGSCCESVVLDEAAIKVLPCFKDLPHDLIIFENRDQLNFKPFLPPQPANLR
jgi:hypothetical protein